jgi:hypothetical protein
MRTILIVIALAALVACDRAGPAEKAGRQVDKAVDNVKDALKGKK